MKIFRENKIQEISQTEFNEIKNKYSKVILDIGTGDGRQVFKTSKQNLNTLVVGLEPNQKQFEEFAKKANREKLKNILWVVGSIELFPKEFYGVCDEVLVYYPWGTLLAGVVKTESLILEKISKCIKTEGQLRIILGYDTDLEPTESQRLELENIDLEKIVKELAKFNLKNTEIQKLTKDEMLEIETTWSKRLAFGKNREIFRLAFIKC